MSAPMHVHSSTTSGLSTGPTTPASCGTRIWDPARDPGFFRIVAHLFSPSTTLAMTVLLASYDEEQASGS